MNYIEDKILFRFVPRVRQALKLPPSETQITLKDDSISNIVVLGSSFAEYVTMLLVNMRAYAGPEDELIKCVSEETQPICTKSLKTDSFSAAEPVMLTFREDVFDGRSQLRRLNSSAANSAFMAKLKYSTGAAPPSVIGDRNMCRRFGFWRDLFQRSGGDFLQHTIFVIVSHTPKNGADAEEWEDCMNGALAGTKGLKRVILHFPAEVDLDGSMDISRKLKLKLEANKVKGLNGPSRKRMEQTHKVRRRPDGTTVKLTPSQKSLMDSIKDGSALEN